MNKPAYTISDRILLLKQKGMLFKDEARAHILLKNINYYRLKGYWWDMQSDFSLHTLYPNVYFEDIIERYDFDRQLRIILFEAIEQIEIALRTKMIYHLSITYGGLWYLDSVIFDTATITLNGITKTAHHFALAELQKEFNRSQEVFIKDTANAIQGRMPTLGRYWKSPQWGTLSKLYKNLRNQLPEKAVIAKEMGLNSISTFEGWLESIALMRNIIAHHARVWSRSMVKRPSMKLNNPVGA